MPKRHLKWHVAQLGAREHYAIARALQAENRLAGFYTDIWSSPWLRWLANASGSATLAAWATRWNSELALEDRVVSWDLQASCRELKKRLCNRTSIRRPEVEHAEFVRTGRWFARLVCEEIRRGTLSLDSIFFSYDTTALETFEYLHHRRIRTVLGQMDPSRVEWSLVKEEERRWPGWTRTPVDVPEEYFGRREQEWKLADRILVNSEYCHKALIEQGVPAEKLYVIPLCYEAVASPRNKGIETPAASRPLRVLFLGQVILRKGIQYLLEAARLLKNEPVHFDVVGPIGISETAVRSAPPNVTFHGRVRRDQVAGWYQRGHVFALPTISDGFAMTQLEAMAHGLPVISTPNCGRVVSHGVDGFMVPLRDSGALAEAVQRYLANPGLLEAQREAALTRSKQFGLARLQKGLLQIEASFRETVTASCDGQRFAEPACV